MIFSRHTPMFLLVIVVYLLSCSHLRDSSQIADMIPHDDLRRSTILDSSPVAGASVLHASELRSRTHHFLQKCGETQIVWEGDSVMTNYVPKALDNPGTPNYRYKADFRTVADSFYVKIRCIQLGKFAFDGAYNARVAARYIETGDDRYLELMKP